MRKDAVAWLSRRPSTPTGWTAAALVSLAWGFLRLAVFGPIIFPLTYVLPLLLCVWTRNKRMLWTMAALYAALHTVKQVAILPANALPTWGDLATYLATLLNISVGGAVVHAILVLRDHLDDSFREVEAQGAELERQNEELTQQAEELAIQSEEMSQQLEEISQQSEELTTQNEELQAQTTEIQRLNSELGQREELLQTLFDAARLAGSERAALQQIARAAMQMLGAPVNAVALYEFERDHITVRAAAGIDEAATLAPAQAHNRFVRLVAQENRPACLNDTSLRPDLDVLQVPGRPPFKAVLGAPVKLASGDAFGVVAAYSYEAHEWTSEQFRLIDWLALQAAHLLEITRLHESLRDADRRKNQFLATLSHELRNPLAPIRFALQLLDLPDGDGQTTRARQVIDRQLSHLVRLIDDLLDITRIASNKVRLRTDPVNIATVVEHAVEACSPQVEQAGHRLTVSVPEEALWVNGDIDRLTQVLVNLLTNAIRYTPAGGTIDVSCHATEETITLSVRDNGIGLRATDLSRVFEMFEQVGEPGRGGLGIGLSLVKELVQLHGGTVSVESDGPGAGAQFTVRLPRAAAPSATDRPARQPGEGGNGTARRILVVDDNVDAAEMMKTLLELDGHDVRTAADAASALELLETTEFDVGLFDIGLPGLSGYELARRTRALHQDLHLVAVTGWGQDADRERARASGFDAHLTKPAEPERLRELIAALGQPPRATGSTLPTA